MCSGGQKLKKLKYGQEIETEALQETTSSVFLEGKVYPQTSYNVKYFTGNMISLCSE